MNVLVAGDLFVDLILSGFPSWPLPGTETFATDFHREVGGGAANTACGLARLGSKTGVLGAVGVDGEWVAERLKSFDVDTSRLYFDPVEPTAVSVAISTAAERTFLTYRGANFRFPEVLASFDGFGQVRHVHVAYAADLETITAIKRHGCSVSLDVGWQPDWLNDPRAFEIVKAVDIFFPNRVEAELMTGETDCKRIFKKLGGPRVVLKRGSEGAAMWWDGEMVEVDPIHVNAVDTTGAGDCFNAGFLHFWLAGESPANCLRAGNVCGALSTQAYGGVNGFPGIERIRQELCVK